MDDKGQRDLREWPALQDKGGQCESTLSKLFVGSTPRSMAVGFDDEPRSFVFQWAGMEDTSQANVRDNKFGLLSGLWAVSYPLTPSLPHIHPARFATNNAGLHLWSAE